MTLDANPVIIIGAPRSGTNMLRDVLVRLREVATWPADEINYIWRHGNVRHPSDEFTASMARPRVRGYVRRQFDRVGRRYGASTVVEKTCANSLRVSFVDAVVPEARYLFIRRDGVDAVGSAMERWKAPLDIPYLVRKVRFVPLTDLPYYGGRYLWYRLCRLSSRERRLGSWGPRLDGMSDLLVRHHLDEVCALQWQRCVEAACGAFETMDTSRWLEIVYEDFVRDPERELARITAFLDLDIAGDQRAEAVAGVRADSIGKGRDRLDTEARHRIETLVGNTLQRFGYA